MLGLTKTGLLAKTLKLKEPFKKIGFLRPIFYRDGRGPDQPEQAQHPEGHDGPDPEAELNIRNGSEASQQRGHRSFWQQPDILRNFEVTF